jgi:hypothetical protein
VKLLDVLLKVDIKTTIKAYLSMSGSTLGARVDAMEERIILDVIRELNKYYVLELKK